MQPASHLDYGLNLFKATFALSTSLEQSFISLHSTETMPATSSATQNTNERPNQSSNQGKQPSKPRKRYHGTTPIRNEFLRLDRLKPQTTNTTPPGNTPRMLRKPPGLSTPPESVSEMETQRQPDDDDPGSELCFICGNSMKERYFSLAPCNNAFCHNCSLRLRALYKSTNCPFCKVFSQP